MHVKFPEKVVVPFGRLDRLEFSSFALFQVIAADPGIEPDVREALMGFDGDEHVVVDMDGRCVLMIKVDGEQRIVNLEYMSDRHFPISFGTRHRHSSIMILPFTAGRVLWRPVAWSIHDRTWDHACVDADIRAMVRLHNFINIQNSRL